jgi:hypothetical protein
LARINLIAIIIKLLIILKFFKGLGLIYLNYKALLEYYYIFIKNMTGINKKIKVFIFGEIVFKLIIKEKRIIYKKRESIHYIIFLKYIFNNIINEIPIYIYYYKKGHFYNHYYKLYLEFISDYLKMRIIKQKKRKEKNKKERDRK